MSSTDTQQGDVHVHMRPKDEDETVEVTARPAKEALADYPAPSAAATEESPREDAQKEQEEGPIPQEPREKSKQATEEAGGGQEEEGVPPAVTGGQEGEEEQGAASQPEKSKSEKSLRFEEQPKVVEIPPSSTEESEIEDQVEELPGEFEEPYHPPPVPLDEVELKRLRRSLSRTSSGETPVRQGSTRLDIVAPGPVALTITAQPLDAQALGASQPPEQHEGGSGPTKEDFAYPPSHKFLEGAPDVELKEASPDPRPLPGTTHPPGRDEQFTQPPLDRLEREARELEAAREAERKRREEETAREVAQRNQEREETLHAEERRAELLDLFDECQADASVMLGKYWDTFVMKAATPGVQAEEGRKFLSSLRDAKGLIYLQQHKRGLVVTADTGAGWVAVKHANGQWAGPSFVKIRGIGVGLSAGSATNHTFVFLHDPKDVAALARGEAEVQLSGAVTATNEGETIEAGVSTGASSGHAVNRSFSLAEGALIDLSISGARVSPDVEANEVVWGKEASAKGVREILGEGNEKGPHPMLREVLEHIHGWIVAHERINVGNVDLAHAEGRVAPAPEPFWRVFI